MKVNPDFEFRIWTLQEVGELVSKNGKGHAVFRDLLSTTKKEKLEAARWFVLWKLGGVVMQVGTMCLKPMGEVLGDAPKQVPDEKGSSLFLLMESEKVASKKFIAATPGHPEVWKAVEAGDVEILSKVGLGLFLTLSHLRRTLFSPKVIFMIPSSRIPPIFPPQSMA